MNPSPSPESHHEPVPVTFHRFDFSGDGPPKRVEETRYILFNNWAYRKVCKALGINLHSMQEKARKQQKKAASEGKSAEDVELSEDDVTDLLQVETDDMEAIATLLWGGLLTEDPDLDREEVEKWLTIDNLDYYTVRVLKALSYWMNGDADFDTEAAEEIAREASDNGSDSKAPNGEEEADTVGKEEAAD